MTFESPALWPLLLSPPHYPPLQPYIEPADKALSRDWSVEKEESPGFWADLADHQVLHLPALGCLREEA